jgi:hypothetical protein
MSQAQTVLVHLDEQGVAPLLRSLYQARWAGAIRIRRLNSFGTMWCVKGSLVHATVLDGGTRSEGDDALRQIADWHDGTYFMEDGVLPPARTIRIAMEIVLGDLGASSTVEAAQADGEANQGNDQENLEKILNDLRSRVPGLESLSLLRGGALEASTLHDLNQREWLAAQLEKYFSLNTARPEKLYLQEGKYSLLVMKSGQTAAVLAAKVDTSPEALFWAGEEARRKVLSAELGRK